MKPTPDNERKSLDETYSDNERISLDETYPG